MMSGSAARKPKPQAETSDSVFEYCPLVYRGVQSSQAASSKQVNVAVAPGQANPYRDIRETLYYRE